MSPGKNNAKRRPASLLLRILTCAAVIVVAVLLLYRVRFSPRARMQRAITKMNSPDPAVRAQGAYEAGIIPLAREDMERVAEVLRDLLEKETVKEVKIAVLGAMFKTLSEKNFDILAQYILSDDFLTANIALDAGIRHAHLYPQHAWKIVAVLSVITETKPKSWPVKDLKWILTRKSLAFPTTVDCALKLRYQGHDASVPFSFSEHPCDVRTGEKLDARTIEKRTAEARKFAERLGLPE